jgi:PLP dependent protein
MLTDSQNSPAKQTSDAFDVVLAANLAQTRRRIVTAAERFGRRPQDIALLAVSKQHSPEAIAAVARAGQRDFGENYLQEALDKMTALASLELNWHYIGQIQSNKTRPIAESFHWVHTVDRLKIAERFSEQRPINAPPLNVCIQVKLANEPGKGGVSPLETSSLAAAVAKLPRLRLRGLMCIPPPRDTFDEQLPLFRQCAALLHSVNNVLARDNAPQLDTLSMGMSADLEAAIAAGATIVRVGTGIFGERTRRDTRLGTRDASE